MPPSVDTSVDAARRSACATGQRNLRSGGVFRQLVILWCARACVFVGQALSPANWFFHSSCGSGLRGIRECIDETVHLVPRPQALRPIDQQPEPGDELDELNRDGHDESPSAAAD